jgi:hypothetical protein
VSPEAQSFEKSLKTPVAPWNLMLFGGKSPSFLPCKVCFYGPRARRIPTQRYLLEFANLFVQDTLVVLDYERISVNASQALTEANKMGPCLEPWSETVGKAGSHMF